MKCSTLFQLVTVNDCTYGVHRAFLMPMLQGKKKSGGKLKIKIISIFNSMIHSKEGVGFTSRVPTISASECFLKIVLNYFNFRNAKI